MRRLWVALALSVVFCSMIGAADGAANSQHQGLGHCAGRKDKVGECYRVRGRLRAYAGYPRCRIWPVGTTRLLGVADANALPSNVACGDGFEVYADFLVCPLTEPRETGIQLVCVASAGNIRASEIKSESGR
jgi:hypothetical protein